MIWELMEAMSQNETHTDNLTHSHRECTQCTHTYTNTSLPTLACSRVNGVNVYACIYNHTHEPRNAAGTPCTSPCNACHDILDVKKTPHVSVSVKKRPTYISVILSGSWCRHHESSAARRPQDLGALSVLAQRLCRTQIIILIRVVVPYAHVHVQTQVNGIPLTIAPCSVSADGMKVVPPPWDERDFQVTPTQHRESLAIHKQARQARKREHTTIQTTDVVSVILVLHTDVLRHLWDGVVVLHDLLLFVLLRLLQQRDPR